MNNFLDFIKKDVEAKKTLIQTLPTKTKTNIKKYNATIDSIAEKYNDYADCVRKYLVAKSNSFNIPVDELSLTKINDKIVSLEHVKFLLNPTNNYFEKMGFDGLLYQINNYYVFNFKSLTKILNDFIDKFNQAGIVLKDTDFDYTCYVHEYMQAFLDVRNGVTDNYEKVSEIFEQIYWVNPELIEHIELNLRKLIKKNAKKFNTYIATLQNQAMKETSIKSFAECQEKLRAAYIDLNFITREDVADIIVKAKNGEIDIKQYFENSKVRKNAYSSVISSNVDLNNEEMMQKVYESLGKLQRNLEEYNNYIEFNPLVVDFKEEYLSLIPQSTKKDEYKGLKEIEKTIGVKEQELEKINRKIFSTRSIPFKINSEKNIKQLKMESVFMAKELYELYKTYDKEYFKDKVLSILNNTLTVADLLNLYYSFDYFKKLAIQKVYKVTTYEEIIKYSDSFDLYSMNPTNIIITGVPIFSESEVDRVIVNKYKLSNINLTKEDLDIGSLKALEDKISLLLRCNIIAKSKTDVEHIWFMVEVEKILAKEATSK